MVHQNQMPSKTWKIKTRDGHFLSVESGELKLKDKLQEDSAEWVFQPAEDSCRFYIRHAKTGVTLVDTVNGGYDSWSVEDCFDGSAVLVSQGGLFRHFELIIQQSNVMKKRCVEYYHWLLE